MAKFGGYTSPKVPSHRGPCHQKPHQQGPRPSKCHTDPPLSRVGPGDRCGSLPAPLPRMCMYRKLNFLFVNIVFRMSVVQSQEQ